MNNTDELVKILLVDDDSSLRALLEKFFLSNGCNFHAVKDAVDIVSVVNCIKPSIIILDRMMPDVDGLTALRLMRGGGHTTPVIFLTAQSEDFDRVIGLELGADDYVSKPFMPQELLARVYAILRRGAKPKVLNKHVDTVRRFGEFQLNLSLRTLSRRGVPVRINETEYELLGIMADHPMETLSRARLLAMWSQLHPGFTARGIDVPIFRLRRLIEDDPSNPRIVQTVRGIGYMFVPPVPEGPNDE
jgi:DNA-binding response OmpR family regulator